jgi:hypothetical protein
MPRSGRPPASSLEERRRVYELADAGLSSRAIAEAVYGNRRLNDRVLRLLDRRRRTTVRGVHLETATDEELGALLEVEGEAVTLEELGALFQAASARHDDLEDEGG